MIKTKFDNLKWRFVVHPIYGITIEFGIIVHMAYTIDT